MSEDSHDGSWLGSRLPGICLLLVPLLAWTALRLPAMIHQPGMQDEQWFAVPGLTVLREGIPRIPYVPTRRRETLFENADVCLMALPPGLFYVQAPFFAIFPAGYATARIPLFLGAMVTIGITFLITRRLGGSLVAAGLASLAVAISRPLLFTGLTCRPDLLCTLCGWIALLLVMKFHSRNRLVDSTLIGGVCGLGALFHPLALIFCMQIAAWAMFARNAFGRRVLHVVCMALGTVMVVALWLPLIASFPYEFKSQFFANVLDRAGPGLPARLIWPWPSLAHHAVLFWEFAGPFQTGLTVVAVLIGSVGAIRLKGHGIPPSYIALVWSSIFLTAVVAGMHPTKGYWVYPFVWIIPLFVVVIERWTDWQTGKNRIAAFAIFALCFLAVLFPGGGWKTSWLYLRNWKHPDYHAPTFIANVLQDLPEEGVFFADLSFVFDVYLSGRETRLCQERLQYWGPGPVQYDYLVLSWEGEDASWAQQYDGQLVRRIGSRDVVQHCFVDLYRPSSTRD